jgi:hypothetical protein
MRILLSLAAALCLASTAIAGGRPGADWPQAPAGFASRADLDRAAESFPNSMGLQRRRLAAAIEAKDPAAALDSAEKLAAAGAGLSPAARAQLAPLVSAEALRRLSDDFDTNMAPIARSRLFIEVPPELRLIEGLAIVPGSPTFFATSAVDRGFVTIDAQDGARRLDVGEAGSLLGAAFDPRSRRLWAASAVIDVTPKAGRPFSGLISVDPRRPEGAVRIPAPEGATLGDVAVAGDGTVYASDGLKGAVYACRPGCSALEVAIPPGRLFSAQGLAVSLDQKRLYVADRRYGIAVLDRSTGGLVRLAGAPDMMLDGIDGLVRHGADLIATQTAYSPQRIVRLRLSRDGLRVTRLDVLERAHPDWGEVTLAAAAGDRLLYVAGAQWERFGEGGTVKDDAPLKPTPIRMLRMK